MLTFNECGIYCAQAGVYIDPWKPVSRAVITHAHSDHARWGMQAYLAHRHSVPVMQYRLGADIKVQPVEYGEQVSVNGVKISLHPAGHIWGSAQVRLEHRGEVWVVSGDYKLRPDGITVPFELVPCNSFITESTFGLPVFRFPSVEEVHEDINGWWRKNRSEGKTSVLFTYPLGKAQRVLSWLDASIGRIFTHGAVDNVNRIYETHIGRLPVSKRMDGTVTPKDLEGAMVIAPPSAFDTPWMRRLKPYRTGICSGWMQLRGPRRRRGADRGFVLSDHCDWEELNTAVRATGAEHVYVTHGYKSIYAKWLATEYGLHAEEAETLYTGEQIEDAGDTATENQADESVQ